MKLDDLINQTGEWLMAKGPNSDIVISSRIRLARNLNNFPFTNRANKKESSEILSLVKKSIETGDYLKDSLILNMADLNNVDRQFLLERHLISREHTLEPDSKAVVIGEREVSAIMINEEDHLRIQVVQSGFNLREAWVLIDKIDNELAQKLDFAFSPVWGYLTACPTNTGTAMRASVMLHLPSLVMTKQINRVLQAITKLMLTVRGLYGEGTEAMGNFYQISNQVTLGYSEEDTIDNLERIIRQIIGHEQNARANLLARNANLLKDRIWRAYGTLKNAYIINSAETAEFLSLVRLGVDIGAIKDLSMQDVNELFILIQPAHLQKLEGKALSSNERDAKRAELLRQRLSK